MAGEVGVSHDQRSGLKLILLSFLATGTGLTIFHHFTTAALVFGATAIMATAERL